MAEAEGDELVTESVTDCGDAENGAPGAPVSKLLVIVAANVPPNWPSESEAVKT
jgi:hypothetical protein